ncbi:MAG: DUF4131 domain-containing protein [Thermogutta sp.]|nr:DUF4131 domain-containing protein [Thermogutta sp.]
MSRDASHAREPPPIPQSPWNKPLVPVFFALASGILVDAFIVPRFPLCSLTDPLGGRLSMYTVAGALLLLLWGLLFHSQRPAASGFSLFLSIVFLGSALHYRHANVFRLDEIGRYALRDPIRTDGRAAERADDSPADQADRIEDHAAAPICLEAVVTAVPELIPPPGPGRRPFPVPWENEPTMILPCRVTSVRDGSAWRPASGRIYVYVTGIARGPLPGDRIRLTGQIIGPRAPANPGEFDLRSHRRADRVLAQVYGTVGQGVQVVQRGSLWDPRRSLAVVRLAAADALDRYISPPQAALAKALLLGIRREVDDEFEEQLLRTGTIHLLAISGLHVGIFAGVVVFALRRLRVRPRVRYLTAVVAVAAYLAVSGGQPPAVRAAIILGTYFFGKAILRRSSGWNSLALAGIVVLACNPCDLFRVGPQLSFLSAAVLIAFGRRILREESVDPLERLILESRPGWQRFLIGLGKAAGQSFAISAVLCSVTAPLVMARFHVAAPMGMILTPLLLPFLSLVLAAGFLLMLIGPWCGPIAWLCGTACDATLHLIRLMVELGSAVPYGSLWLPGPPDWWLIGLYAIGGAGVFVTHPRVNRGVFAAALASWGLLLFSYEFVSLRQSRGHLECTVLSVGHGEAVPIHLPDGRTLLYDAGKLLGDRMAARTVAHYLWHRGITHIDAIVISHADLDHYNAVPKLTEYLSIGVIYVEPRMPQSKEPFVRELIELVHRKGIPLKTLAEGCEARPAEGLHISVLHPPADWPERDDNARSLVLRLQFGGESLLLTGDLDGRGVERLLEHPEAACSVLVAPHHGSKNGNPPSLAQRLRPRIVVMSNAIPPARSVSESYRAAGCRIYETRRDGAVTIVLGGRQAEIRPFHRGKDSG